MDLSSLGTRCCFVQLLNGWSEIVCNDFSWLFKARVCNLMSLSLVSNQVSIQSRISTHQLRQHSCPANLDRLLQQVCPRTELLQHLHRCRDFALSPQRSCYLKVGRSIHVHINLLTDRDQLRKIRRRSQGLLYQIIPPGKLRRAND